MLMEILSETIDWFCAKKPANISTQSFIEALKKERSEQKFSPVYDLDDPIEGPVLFAKSLESRAFLKNAYGSDDFLFTFYAWGKCHKKLPESWTCDLSIAWDEQKKRSYPSKNGKKSMTHFSVLNELGDYVYLKCTTHYLRKQQLQTHAHYSGVDILGDSLWTPDEHLVYLEDLKKSVKNSSNKPISSGLHLYLAAVEFPSQSGNTLLQIDEPKSWAVLQKMLERYLI